MRRNHFIGNPVDLPASVMTGGCFDPSEFMVLRQFGFDRIILVIPADFCAAHRIAIRIQFTLPPIGTARSSCKT